VPNWLAEKFDGLEDDPVTRRLVAAAVCAEQVVDLIDRGVKDLHFYTMNRADLVFAICHLIGLRSQEPSAPPSWSLSHGNAPASGIAQPATR
jgi:methylenetetrahydrofolate reductase (NADPH)